MYKWQLVTITWVWCTRNWATLRRAKNITNLLCVLTRKCYDLCVFMMCLFKVPKVSWGLCIRLNTLRQVEECHVPVTNYSSLKRVGHEDSPAPVINDEIYGSSQSSFESSVESSKKRKTKKEWEISYKSFSLIAEIPWRDNKRNYFVT